MRHLILYIALIFFIIILLQYQYVMSNDSSEYDYYDEYYEDEVDDNSGMQSTATDHIESIIMHDEVDVSISGETLQAIELNTNRHSNRKETNSEKFVGFHKSVGGGLVKVKKLLLDEEYLNATADTIGCVKRMEYGILSAEEVEEVQEEVEVDVVKQVTGLKRRMERIAMAAMGGASSETESSVVDASSSGDITNNKHVNDTMVIASSDTTTIEGDDNTALKSNRRKLTYREKQDIRMKERKAQEAAREKLRPKFRVGADCETLICGACKAIVEEFGHAVKKASKDPAYPYVEDVFTTGFCKMKDVALKYTEIVTDVCNQFEQESLGYRDALLLPFETHSSSWDEVVSPSSLMGKKMKVCVDIGACELDQFEFQDKPLYYTQQHWDDKCFVCQAFARDLEERVQLTRYVTEGNIIPIVEATCDRLNLEPRYQSICLALSTDKLLDDVSWLAKVHRESIARKAKAELAFPDKLCEEIDYCKAYIDPEKLREKQAQETMEQVFF